MANKNKVSIEIRNNKLISKHSQKLEVRYYLTTKGQPDLVDASNGDPITDESVFICSFTQDCDTGKFSELLYHAEDYRLNNALHKLTNFVSNKFLSILKPQRAIRSKEWLKKKAKREAVKLEKQKELDKLQNGNAGFGDKINTTNEQGDY